MRKIIIGCDNAGVELKNTLISFLKSKGVEIENVGCDSADDKTFYPTIAEKVCTKVIESGYKDRGILVCGTGIGMCMTANKFKGIRAAVCHDNFSAERSILSNNGNVLCFGARVIGPELAKKIVGEWVSLEFVDSPSTEKVEDMIRIERVNFK